MAGMGAASASSSVVAAAERKAISQSITSHSISRSIIQSISPRSGRRELRTLVIKANALLRGAVLASHRRRRIAATGHQGRAHDVADVTCTQRLAQLLDQVLILAALLLE